MLPQVLLHVRQATKLSFCDVHIECCCQAFSRGVSAKVHYYMLMIACSSIVLVLA